MIFFASSVEQTQTTLLIGIWVFSIILGLVVFKYRKSKLLRSISKLEAWKIASYLVIIVGFSAVIAGVITSRQAWNISRYKTTSGTVKNVGQSSDVSYRCGRFVCKGTEEPEYRMTVAYSVNNKSYTITEIIKAESRSFNKGDIVKVAYNPSNPQNQSKIVSNYADKALGPALIIVGSIFMVIGITVMLIKKRLTAS